MKLSNIKILISIIVIGIIAGIVGIVLTNLLHYIQELAFGIPNSIGHISFKVLVESANPYHRLLVLLLCGAIGGLGWLLLHRYGSGIVEIKDVVQKENIRMPIFTMILHPLLQIITVGLGSPLGREVAPREMTVALTTGWFKWTGWEKSIDSKSIKVLLACAAGAGLASVYNAPLASAIFILETLVVAWTFEYMVAAFLSCAIAAYVVRMGLGDTLQYPLSSIPFSDWIIVWSFIIGPLIGLAVYVFNKCNGSLPKMNRKSWGMIATSIISFGLVGCMSMYFPEILGNGKPGVQLAFTANLTWQYALGLFLSKWGALLLATFAGAYGGRISPSMMLGSLLAFLVALVWNMLLPNLALPLEVCAVVGAATFLGCAQKMHMTAIIFLLELSRFSPAYFFPMCMCMGLAMLTLRILKNI